MLAKVLIAVLNYMRYRLRLIVGFPSIYIAIAKR